MPGNLFEQFSDELFDTYYKQLKEMSQQEPRDIKLEERINELDELRSNPQKLIEKVKEWIRTADTMIAFFCKNPDFGNSLEKLVLKTEYEKIFLEEATLTLIEIANQRITMLKNGREEE